MNTRLLRKKILHAAAIFSLAGLAGCQSANFYSAESMPRSLMLPRQSSAQEANLTNFTNVTGTSSEIGAGDRLELTISASLNQDCLLYTSDAADE